MAREPTAYIVLSWIYFTITLTLVVNRLSVRLHHRVKPGGRWSDGLVVVAWVFFVPQYVLDTYMYATNAFVDQDHPEDTNDRTAAIFTRIYHAENLFYFIPFYYIKGAVLLFLMEVTPPTYRYLRVAIWIGMGLCVVALPLTIVALMMSCSQGPVPEWKRFLTYRLDTCWDVHVATGIITGSHMFTDIYIYTIPFFLLRHLNTTPRSQRIGSYIMFCAGFTVVFLALLQMPIFSVRNQFWAAIHEQLFAFAVPCLPSPRVTFQRLRHNWHEQPGRRRQRGELSTMEVAPRLDDGPDARLGDATLLSQAEKKEAISIGTIKSEDV